MENPMGWDLLTSCLAVCDLDDLEESWAFLQDQGVVDARGRESFMASRAGGDNSDKVREEFSRSARAAGWLETEQLATERGAVADPWARNAAERFLDWTLQRCIDGWKPPDTNRDLYFLLRRCRVEGPFDLDQLEGMSGRGELHEFRGVFVRGNWVPLLPHGIVLTERSTVWSSVLGRFGLGSGTGENWIAPLDYALELGGGPRDRPRTRC